MKGELSELFEEEKELPEGMVEGNHHQDVIVEQGQGLKLPKNKVSRNKKWWKKLSPKKKKNSPIASHEHISLIELSVGEMHLIETLPPYFCFSIIGTSKGNLHYDPPFCMNRNIKLVT